MRKPAFLLIVLSVLVSPLVFLRQWASYLGLLSGAYTLGQSHRTSDILLIIREGLPILFVLAVALSRPSFWRSRRLLSIVWLFLLLVSGFSVSLLVQPYSSASFKVGLIAGGRFLIFFLLPLAVFVFLSGAHPKRAQAYYKVLLSVVVGVLLLNLVASLMEVWLGSGYVGEQAVGQGYTAFGPRAIGITVNPNTAGTLFGLSGLLILFRLRPTWLWLSFWLASIFGSLLTGSRTGILGTVIVGIAALMLTRPRLRPLYILLSLPILLYLLSNLDFLSGRADLLSFFRESGAYDVRISTLAENVQKMNWLELMAGRGLGYASNTAFRVLSEAEAAHAELITADSLVTLTILEFGFLGATVFWAIASLFFLTFTSRGLSNIFLLYFGFFSLTQNFLESYPSSVLLGVILGCCAAQRCWYERSAGSVKEDLTPHW
jgi:hypothetical protein